LGTIRRCRRTGKGKIGGKLGGFSQEFAVKWNGVTFNMRRITSIGIISGLTGVLLIVAMTVSLGQSLDEAETLEKKHAELYNAGKYVEALAVAQRVLEIRQKILGTNHPAVARAINNLAVLSYVQGRYADAESLYRRSLAIFEKVLDPNHPDIAISVNNLGGLYRDEGRFTDAEPLLKRSLEIREKALGPDNPSIATALNSLALLYESQGRYDDAEPLYQRSLVIREKALGPDHPDVALSLNNLANLYQERGRYADAESLYKRSLTIKEKARGTNHPSVALTLNNLAGVYQHQGRYADAEPLYKRSFTIWEKALGPDHPDVAKSLENLALLYKSQGRYDDAEPLYKRSLVMQEKALGLDHPDVAQVLNNLAALYQHRGRYADALPFVKRLMMTQNAAKEVALPIFFGLQKENLISSSQGFVDSYDVLQRASTSSVSKAISSLAARFAAGSDELADLVRKDQDLTTEADRLDRAIIAAASKPAPERNFFVEAQIRSRIDAVKLEREELQRIFNKRLPDYVALAKPIPLTKQETQALLASDEALVLLGLGDQSYAWVITQTDAYWTALNVAAEELSEEVKALRSSLTFDIDKPFDTQLAFKIYQQTIGTVAGKLRGKSRLSLVTNGALTSLPLQLLVTKEPGNKPLKEVDWFARSYAITNVPSVASLKTLRSKSVASSAGKPMIAFADPVFSKDPNSQAVVSRNAKSHNAQRVALRSVVDFYEAGQPDLASLARALPQLPDTANEVRAIAEALKADKSDLKLGVFASETTVKQTKLDAYRIVYFATHGLVAGDVEKFAKVKAEPALALTIPETSTDLDDGLLTASEVAQLKLNADWVVLSACNTAAEGNPGAEALSGLARAFFYAGARSLVVSHWEVDSKATVQLMTGTFEAAARDPKLSHAEALRQSMLSMIDNANSDDDAHPRVWAPFVVVGEPGIRK
jgi:CHAT domain-containing protein/Tfp pilus assembly protein PilF